MELPPLSPPKAEEKMEELRFATAFKAIQIALDEYQDIFSDFDTAPYHRRTLSDDFLKEIERRYMETEKGEFEVRLTLPAIRRDLKVEAVIRKRLKDYFVAKLKEKDAEIERRKKLGLTKVLLGVVIVIGVFELPLGQIIPLATILSVLSWYAMWSGYENLFDIPGKLGREQEFFKKFSKARYYFISEEAVSEQRHT